MATSFSAWLSDRQYIAICDNGQSAIARNFKQKCRRVYSSACSSSNASKFLMKLMNKGVRHVNTCKSASLSTSMSNVIGLSTLTGLKDNHFSCTGVNPRTSLAAGTRGTVTHRRALSCSALANVDLNSAADTALTHQSMQKKCTDVLTEPDGEEVSLGTQQFEGQKQETELKLRQVEMDEVDFKGNVSEKQQAGYQILAAEEAAQMWSAAWLRAEAHFEPQQHSRFTESLKKRFAEQEFQSLRTKCRGRFEQSLKTVCLVAIETDTEADAASGTPRSLLENTLGTLDVSMRQLGPREILPEVMMPLDPIASTAEALQGLFRKLQTQAEPRIEGGGTRRRTYGYISNVCVAKTARRRRIGYNLLQAAIRAASDWGLEDLYCHVNVDNQPAWDLYMQSGFTVLHETSGVYSKKPLENTALLHLKLP